MGHNFITEKQESYCQYRADGRNKTDSRRLAGYEDATPQRACEEACKMEKNPKVAQRILDIKTERAEETKFERMCSMRVLSDIGESEPGWFWIYDEQKLCWRLKKPYELSKRAWNCIKRVTKNGYEFHSKIDAIKVLAAMCGWNSIQVNQQSDSVLRFDTLYFGLPDGMVEDAEQ